MAGLSVSAARLHQWQAGGVKFMVRSPAASLPEQKATNVEHSGKIILPNSAMLELAHIEIQYPMVFKIWNPSNPRRRTHCGVLEFTADEGQATVPYWMMQLLGLPENGLLAVESARSLLKGTFVKLRPQQVAFTELTDPRAVLEKYLRSFSCLTRGDTIKIHYNRREYDIDIVELKAGAKDAEVVSIVETDMNVDFDTPVDMPAQPPRPAAAAPAASEGMTFGNTLLDRQESGATPAAAPAPAAQPASVAFAGAGRTVSGKQRTSSGLAPMPAAGAPATAPASAPALKRDSYGRVLKDQSDAQPAAPSTFKAFSGAGRSLR